MADRFRAEFPSKPERYPLDNNRDFSVESWDSIDDAGSYEATFWKFKTRDPSFETMETQFMRSACASNYDNLIAFKERVVNGWPEFDMTVQDSEGSTTKMRAIKMAGVFAQLIATYDTDTTSEPPSVSRFLNSLEWPPNANKGPVTTAGPALKRFPLGDSGISAEFPSEPKFGAVELPFDQGIAMGAVQPHLAGFQSQEPKDPRSAAGALKTYLSTFGMRIFIVAYIDLPPVILKEAPRAEQVLRAAVDEMVKAPGFKGARVEASMGKLGPDPALTFKVGLGQGMRMQGLAALRKGRIVYVFAGGPKVFVDCPEFKEFLGSLQFAD